MNRKEEIIWLAGWLEGEGSFQCTHELKADKMSVFKRFRITASSTDRDVAYKVFHLLNGRIYRNDSNKIRYGWKVKWIVEVNGKHAIGWMMTIYGLMGERRKAEIKDVINQWKEYSSKLNPALKYGTTLQKL